MSTSKTTSAQIAVFAAVSALASTSTAHTSTTGFDVETAKQIARDSSLFNSDSANTDWTVRTDTSNCPQSTTGQRIDSLPYWSMEESLPCMYSGELLSSDTYENYMFYWLATRPDSLTPSGATDAPLIVYLNGGPGSTSMNALWTGNGPLRVTETGSSVQGEDFEITYDTTISWQAAGDLLWVDQPVGTGWSTGEHTVTSLDEIGEEFVSFLLSFYEEHPKYKTCELVLTGESFAGKYLSYTARAILDYNDDESHSFKFDLNNMILSNPLVDTPTERLNQHAVGWALGFYDDYQTEQVEVLRRHCEEAPSLGLEPSDQSTACKNILNYITKGIGSVEQMDASHFNYEDFIDNESFTDLFTISDKLTQLKDALHITKAETFERTNSTVADAIADRENNAASVYTELLSRGLKILINVGNYDQKDGVRSTLEWIKQVDFPDREMFDLQPRKVYKYLDQFDGSEKVGGFYRHHENFTAIVVPQAGHMVPAYQPYVTMKFVQNFIEKGYLYCETDSNGSCKSEASYMCKYMNDCNGQGTCNSYGKCECDSGWFGPDCTTQLTDLTAADGNSASETFTASRWFYYVVPADSGDFQVSVTSDRALSVYVRKGTTDLPDTVTFDALVQDDTDIVLSSQMMNVASGAIFAVHVSGEPEDTTTFSIELAQLENLMVRNSYEFLDLAAMAEPAAPKPMFNNGEGMGQGNDKVNDEVGLLSDWQFAIIGAVLGIVATVIYYQMARFCQQYRQSRMQRTCDVENQRAAAATCAPEDPNKYLFKRTFKEDDQHSDQ